MFDEIKKLTPEQALEVVERLSDKESGIRDAVLAEAKRVLAEVDLDEVAEDVFLGPSQNFGNGQSTFPSSVPGHCWPNGRNMGRIRSP